MRKLGILFVIAVSLIAVRRRIVLSVAHSTGAIPVRLVTIAPGEILAAGEVVIRNDSESPLSITNISVLGDDKGVFLLGPTPAEIAPLSSASLTLTFRPGNDEGVSAGRVLVEASNGDSNADLTLCARATNEAGAIGSLASCTPPPHPSIPTA
ncbi:MAG: hypothetical protein JNM17_05465, partial [Archangium sp.]|nr:hypothetical protein [Archangium sp.]